MYEIFPCFLNCCSLVSFRHYSTIAVSHNAIASPFPATCLLLFFGFCSLAVGKSRCVVLLRWLVVNQRETTGCKPMHTPNLAHTQRAVRVKTVSHSSQEWSKSKSRLPQPSTQTTILNFPSAAGAQKRRRRAKVHFLLLPQKDQINITCATPISGLLTYLIYPRSSKVR